MNGLPQSNSPHTPRLRYRKRVYSYHREKFKCQTRSQITERWLADKTFAMIPRRFFPYLFRITGSKRELAVLLAVIDFSVCRPALDFKGPEKNKVEQALEGRYYTPPLVGPDIAGMSDINENGIAAAFEEEVRNGVIERKCGCSAGRICGNQADHHSYRCRFDNWPNIKREDIWEDRNGVHDPDTGRFAPKKPVCSEGLGSDSPIQAEQDQLVTSEPAAATGFRPSDPGAQAHPGDGSEVKDSHCDATGFSVDELASQSRPMDRVTLAIPTKPVEIQAGQTVMIASKPIPVHCKNEMSAPTLVSASIPPNGQGFCFHIHQTAEALSRHGPSFAAPAVDLPASFAAPSAGSDPCARSSGAPPSKATSTSRDALIAGLSERKIACEPSYADQVLQNLAPASLAYFFECLDVEAAGKRKARKPFNPARYLHVIAEQVCVKWKTAVLPRQHAEEAAAQDRRKEEITEWLRMLADPKISKEDHQVVRECLHKAGHTFT